MKILVFYYIYLPSKNLWCPQLIQKRWPLRNSIESWTKFPLSQQILSIF